MFRIILFKHSITSGITLFKADLKGNRQGKEREVFCLPVLYFSFCLVF